MSDLADRHRRIAEIVERFEQLGVDAAVDERITAEGDLCLTVELRIPPALDPSDAGEAAERIAELEALCERLREAQVGVRAEIDSVEDESEGVQAERRAVGSDRDGVDGRVDAVVRRTEGLGERLAILEEQTVASESTAEADRDAADEDGPAGGPAGLTDGERGTLRALQELGGSRASGEIAEEVDATIQSVRSWLPKLVAADHIRAEPDPTDGRRKLYSAIDADDPALERTESTDDERTEGDERTESDDVERAEGDERAESADGDRPGHDENADPDDVERTGGDENVHGTVYIASAGGSPSQVFHVREDCPQLRKSSGFVEKDRSVVPHHRPCGNCVPDGLEGSLVAIAKNSPTTTYHRREDCPKLGAAIDVAVVDRETVPNYEPCDDCAPLNEDGAGEANGEGESDQPDGEDESDEADAADRTGAVGVAVDDHTAAQLCARNGLHREAVVAAVDGATSIYHVQRDLGLSREETETLLEALDLFDTLDGGGHVTTERATAAGEHVPATTESGSSEGKSGD